MIRERQNRTVWTVPFHEGKHFRRGPVFVALDDGNAVIGVERIDTLTTLGALRALCEAKAKYADADAVVTGLVNVDESGHCEGGMLRVNAPNSAEEHRWWNELLLWDANGNRLDL